MNFRILDDIHLLAASAADVATNLRRIADCVCKHPSEFSVFHTPVKESEMASKPKSFCMKRPAKSASPAVKGDTVTIGGILNTDGSPYTGADPTIVPTSSDPATLTTGTVTGLSYPETFLQAGTVTVSIAATFPDPAGTVVTQVDTVVITASPTVPGSFTVTHSLPIA